MEEGQDPPQYFSDVFDFTFTPYGLSITFGRTPPRQVSGRPEQPEDQVVVRMSLEQAKILSMLLRAKLSQWERQNRLEIGIPHQVYTSVGVAREDWPDVHG